MNHHHAWQDGAEAGEEEEEVAPQTPQKKKEDEELPRAPESRIDGELASSAQTPEDALPYDDGYGQRRKEGKKHQRRRPDEGKVQTHARPAPTKLDP